MVKRFNDYRNRQTYNINKLHIFSINYIDNRYMVIT